RGWDVVRLATDFEPAPPSTDDLLALADAVREASRAPAPPAQACDPPPKNNPRPHLPRSGKRGHLSVIRTDEDTWSVPAFEDIVKANDVRGVVPDQLSANITRAFGAAFADHVGADVVVGHDMRTSSHQLVEAFIDGATARGVNVTH